MSQEARRKQIEEYSNEELAHLLNDQRQKAREVVGRLDHTLLNDAEELTDDDVAALWETADMIDAAARNLTRRTVEADAES
jgi:6-pyruvoyl-tetrahydropterin synthase